MLTAQDQQGESVILYRYPKEQIASFKKKSFYCPVCREKVYIRAGDRMIPHFAHYKKGACKGQMTGEGDVHRQGKMDLFDWLTNQRIPAALEFYLPAIQQRPDILIKWNHRLFSIEYQCSPISREMFLKRTKSYHRLGIIPLWISGSKHILSNYSNKVRLSNYEQYLFYQWNHHSPAVLYFYSPHNKKLTILQQPYALRSVHYGTCRIHPLSHLSFPQLFHITYQSDSWIFSVWKKVKSQFRLHRSNFYGNEDARYRRWLYSMGYHPQHLPSVIHLPTPNHFQLELPPYIWQSRIILSYLHPLSSGMTFTAENVYQVLGRKMLSRKFLPFVRTPFNPIDEYLHLLQLTGHVETIRDGVYRKRKDFQFFHTLDQALAEDEKLLRFLAKMVNRSSRYSNHEQNE